ncbi:MAG: arginase family protein [Parvularculaceae bacterium]
MSVESEQSECRRWRSIADLLEPGAKSPIAFIGAPLNEKALTPGRCDLAPKVVRETLKRMSVYDLETATDLGGFIINDLGDLDLKLKTPEEAFAPIQSVVSKAAYSHDLVIMIGGHNAVTRPGVRALGDLKRVGLLTLDAHFDMRDTDCGLNNGNPVRALLEDGFPGENIVQVGLQPFANTKRMHDAAKSAGITVKTMSHCFADGGMQMAVEGLSRLSSRCETIYVDFDIDVIDRSECPGAPGARPGGLAVREFFAAARAIATHPKVKVVDLTEFDPSLDIGGTSALTAARWVAEVLAGYTARIGKS